MKQPSNKNIKLLLESAAFQEFQERAVSAMNILLSLKTMPDGTDHNLGIEVKARLRAADIVNMIFDPYVNFAEKPDFSDEQVQAAKDKYGL